MRMCPIPALDIAVDAPALPRSDASAKVMAIGLPNLRRGIVTLILILALSPLSISAPALAQRNIGSAITVERDVSGALAGRTRTVAAGDGVFANENIRTASASTTQLRFLDQTNLTIGPTASVVLDRFVYNPDQTVRDATLRITAGAARWVGAASQAGVVRIRTPHAIIGIRGTSFDLLVEALRTMVILRAGEVVVCLISAPQRCATLATPGLAVLATRSEIRGPLPAGPTSAQFTANCLSAIDRAVNVCVSRAFAALIQTASAVPAPQNCLRALDGSCTRPDIVEATRQRAVIIPSVRVSYYGTPAGSIGDPNIPFARLFQDNDILFGLPTAVCAACPTYRSK